jgi:hypothetical protein
MTDSNNALAGLFAACWKDEAFEAPVMSDPKSVLAEHGIGVPDRIEVRVVESVNHGVHVTGV